MIIHSSLKVSSDFAPDQILCCTGAPNNTDLQRHLNVKWITTGRRREPADSPAEKRHLVFERISTARGAIYYIEWFCRSKQYGGTAPHSQKNNQTLVENWTDGRYLFLAAVQGRVVYVLWVWLCERGCTGTETPSINFMSWLMRWKN